jgi:1-phosphatidylinositol-4-phosphate 5-kinase
LREIIKREKPVPLERTAAKMPDEILDERKNLVFYSDDGGFRATHETGEPGGEIYYLGVIDCLTHVSAQPFYSKGAPYSTLTCIVS